MRALPFGHLWILSFSLALALSNEKQAESGDPLKEIKAGSSGSSTGSNYPYHDYPPEVVALYGKHCLQASKKFQHDPNTWEIKYDWRYTFCNADFKGYTVYCFNSINFLDPGKVGSMQDFHVNCLPTEHCETKLAIHNNLDIEYAECVRNSVDEFWNVINAETVCSSPKLFRRLSFQSQRDTIDLNIEAFSASSKSPQSVQRTWFEDWTPHQRTLFTVFGSKSWVKHNFVKYSVTATTTYIKFCADVGHPIGPHRYPLYIFRGSGRVLPPGGVYPTTTEFDGPQAEHFTQELTQPPMLDGPGLTRKDTALHIPSLAASAEKIEQDSLAKRQHDQSHRLIKRANFPLDDEWHLRKCDNSNFVPAPPGAPRIFYWVGSGCVQDQPIIAVSCQIKWHPDPGLRGDIVTLEFDCAEGHVCVAHPPDFIEHFTPKAFCGPPNEPVPSDSSASGEHLESWNYDSDLAPHSDSEGSCSNVQHYLPSPDRSRSRSPPPGSRNYLQLVMQAYNTVTHHKFKPLRIVIESWPTHLGPHGGHLRQFFYDTALAFITDPINVATSVRFCAFVAKNIHAMIQFRVHGYVAALRGRHRPQESLPKPLQISGRALSPGIVHRTVDHVSFKENINNALPSGEPQLGLEHFSQKLANLPMLAGPGPIGQDTALHISSSASSVEHSEQEVSLAKRRHGRSHQLHKRDNIPQDDEWHLRKCLEINHVPDPPGATWIFNWVGSQCLNLQPTISVSCFTQWHPNPANRGDIITFEFHCPQDQVCFDQAPDNIEHHTHKAFCGPANDPEPSDSTASEEHLESWQYDSDTAPHSDSEGSCSSVQQYLPTPSARSHSPPGSRNYLQLALQAHNMVTQHKFKALRVVIESWPTHLGPHGGHLRQFFYDTAFAFITDPINVATSVRFCAMVAKNIHDRIQFRAYGYVAALRGRPRESLSKPLQISGRALSPEIVHRTVDSVDHATERFDEKINKALPASESQSTKENTTRYVPSSFTPQQYHQQEELGVEKHEHGHSTLFEKRADIPLHDEWHLRKCSGLNHLPAPPEEAAIYEWASSACYLDRPTIYVMCHVRWHPNPNLRSDMMSIEFRCPEGELCFDQPADGIENMVHKAFCALPDTSSESSSPSPTGHLEAWAYESDADSRHVSPDGSCSQVQSYLPTPGGSPTPTPPGSKNYLQLLMEAYNAATHTKYKPLRMVIESWPTHLGRANGHLRQFFYDTAIAYVMDPINVATSVRFCALIAKNVHAVLKFKASGYIRALRGRHRRSLSKPLQISAPIRAQSPDTTSPAEIRRASNLRKRANIPLSDEWHLRKCAGRNELPPPPAEAEIYQWRSSACFGNRAIIYVMCQIRWHPSPNVRGNILSLEFHCPANQACFNLPPPIVEHEDNDPNDRTHKAFCAVPENSSSSETPPPSSTATPSSSGHLEYWELQSRSRSQDPEGSCSSTQEYIPPSPGGSTPSNSRNYLQLLLEAFNVATDSKYKPSRIVIESWPTHLGRANGHLRQFFYETAVAYVMDPMNVATSVRFCALIAKNVNDLLRFKASGYIRTLRVRPRKRSLSKPPEISGPVHSKSIDAKFPDKINTLSIHERGLYEQNVCWHINWRADTIRWKPIWAICNGDASMSVLCFKYRDDDNPAAVSSLQFVHHTCPPRFVCRDFWQFKTLADLWSLKRRRPSAECVPQAQATKTKSDPLKSRQCSNPLRFKTGPAGQKVLTVSTSTYQAGTSKPVQTQEAYVLVSTPGTIPVERGAAFNEIGTTISLTVTAAVVIVQFFAVVRALANGHFPWIDIWGGGVVGALTPKRSLDDTVEHFEPLGLPDGSDSKQSLIELEQGKGPLHLYFVSGPPHGPQTQGEAMCALKNRRNTRDGHTLITSVWNYIQSMCLNSYTISWQCICNVDLEQPWEVSTQENVRSYCKNPEFVCEHFPDEPNAAGVRPMRARCVPTGATATTTVRPNQPVTCSEQIRYDVPSTSRAGGRANAPYFLLMTSTPVFQGDNQEYVPIEADELFFEIFNPVTKRSFEVGSMKDTKGTTFAYVVASASVLLVRFCGILHHNTKSPIQIRGAAVWATTMVLPAAVGSPGLTDGTK